MNFKDLVLAVSNETQFPAATVRKIALATLKKLSANVELGEKFSSPALNVISKTLQPMEKIDKDGVTVIIPERKVGRLIPK